MFSSFCTSPSLSIAVHDISRNMYRICDDDDDDDDDDVDDDDDDDVQDTKDDDKNDE